MERVNSKINNASNATKVTIEQMDLKTYLSGVTIRLQLFAKALMAFSGAESIGICGHPILLEFGNLLDSEAKKLNLAKEAICKNCALTDLVETFELIADPSLDSNKP